MTVVVIMVMVIVVTIRPDVIVVMLVRVEEVRSLSTRDRSNALRSRILQINGRALRLVDPSGRVDRATAA